MATGLTVRADLAHPAAFPAASVWFSCFPHLGVGCGGAPAGDATRGSGPRPSTARQGRAQCRGFRSPRARRRLCCRWVHRAAAGGALDHIEAYSATHSALNGHSSCARPVTRGEDELWVTPFAVIGHVRRQHNDAGIFCHADRARLSGGKPHRRRASAEERKRRGSTVQAGHRTGVRCSASLRHDDDDAVTARMAPFVERSYVFTGNGVFVCKANVRQHT